MKKYIAIWTLMICCSNIGIGQNIKSLQTKIITVDTCLYQLDSFIVDPSSVKIKPSLSFKIIGNYIQFDCFDPSFKPQSILVQYRTLVSNFHQPQFNIDNSLLRTRENAIPVSDIYLNQKNATSPLINSDRIDYNGSISRGFSVGNSQSLVLNSNLNLQLNGNLGNGINVLAAISDDNIPIQADGNTQLLQEFDKVFIKINKDRTDIIAGDYDISNGVSSHFSRYYKKLQGLRIDNSSNIGTGTVNSSANIAISRGKFARQILNVQEGNQGPYKLTGNNGERFLIVLQGSERVYYDGILLKRGLDYDYVIDYNNAELTFTPRQLIRRESRIIVEYEYTDQNYLRSLYTINTEYTQDDYSVYFNIYNEQDSKNATGQIELDSVDVALLTQGDGDPLSLFRTGIREANPPAISQNNIYYLKKYNQESGDTILVYTPSYTENAVSAFFSEVQLGQGDYKISNNAGANGRVYEYVGKGNGNYLPVIQLIAPEKRQLISVGATYKLNNKSIIQAETSFSNFDENRFSTFDNVDNKGMAGRISFSQNSFQDTIDKKWVPRINASYEFLDEKFRFLNPYRNQEFNRDWNITSPERTQEQLFQSKVSLSRGSKLNLEYHFDLYDRAQQFSGMRHIPTLNFYSEGTRIDVKINLLSTKGNIENTYFSRPTIELSQNLSWLSNWKIRGKYLGEKNERKSVQTEVLSSASFAFDEYYLYLDSPQNNGKNASFYLKRRIDKLPRNNQLIQSVVVDEAGIQGNLNSRNTGLLWNISYRNFDVKDEELVASRDASTILGRVDYKFIIKDGFINSTSSFNIGSGQESRREYQFIKVEKGEGNYIYLGDLNGDGEDQINEYEVAVFADQADYIRVNVVNNEFIRTENQSINQSIRINPEKLFEKVRNGWSKWLSKISTTSIFKIDQKKQSDSGKSGFLNFDPGDSTTVSFNALINNILFINRGNPLYDVQFGHRYNNTRFVQITGFEQRNNNHMFIKFRYNPHRSFDIINSIEWGNRVYDSEFFDNKDLNIRLITINPKMVYRPSIRLRFTVQYAYSERFQQINNMESSQSHELNISATWRQASTSSLTGSLRYVDVQFEGLTNTPVSYSMLEGLNRGNNFLWNLDFTRRLSGNVDLLFSYEGRKTGSVPTVHIGRMQVRANF